MFSTNYSVYLLLVVIQVVAALPWVGLLFVNQGRIGRAMSDWGNRYRQGNFVDNWLLTRSLIGIASIVLLPLVFAALVGGTNQLETSGYLYGIVLQLQLLADAFILVFALLLRLWPKGGAIALAAFREGVRQPMFWLLFLVAFVAMGVSPLIPYFTFGEDHLMVKEIGIDTIMLFAAVFGALAASMSVSEEIEGRTAVTLMSKPVSRRDFLVGKFLGIVLAGAVLFVLLGTWYEGVTLFKHWWDKMDTAWWQKVDTRETNPAPAWVMEMLQSWALPGESTDLLRGVGLWTHLTMDSAPGLILGFSQVMVLVAIAVSLATRVPMVVNLVIVVVVFFLAHLTPVLVSIGYRAQAANPGAMVSQILYFMAQLFDLLLPNLESFRLEATLLNETPISAANFAKYIGSVSLYGVLYTSIVLLFGLILFEDRDLA